MQLTEKQLELIKRMNVYSPNVADLRKFVGPELSKKYISKGARARRFCGSYRTALVVGDVVFKFAHFNDLLSGHSRISRQMNLHEYETWKNAKPNERNFLCPVLYCDENGLFNVMMRAKPISPITTNSAWEKFYERTFSKEYTQFTDDKHEGNFGYLGERLVLLDYAGYGEDYN